MISTLDRHEAVSLINEAVAAGARQRAACAEMGIAPRTLERWTVGGLVKTDGRPEAKRAAPRNKLTPPERASTARGE